MIPQFPQFTPIALEQKAAFDTVLAQCSLLASEYTFTNLYAWGSVYDYQVARFGDGLLVRKGPAAKRAFLQPLVPGDGTAAVAACFDYLQQAGATTPHLERVGEDFVARTRWDVLSATMREDRANFDYVYSVPELIELRGEKYHDKKNLINQFTSHFDYHYLPMTPEVVERSLRFQHEWCADRECEKDTGLAQEQCAVHRMLCHFSALKLSGGFIEVEGRLVALTFGERLNEETLVVHVEKAKSGMPGLYQAINWEFLRHVGAAFPYVNREQDLGLPGLRKAKQSYNPVRLIKKYVVSNRA